MLPSLLVFATSVAPVSVDMPRSMFAASYLDVRFLLALVVLAGVRWLSPPRFVAPVGALASAVLLGLASPPTVATITVIVVGLLFPLHRLTFWLREERASPLAAAWLLQGGVWLLVTALVVTKAYRYFTIPFLDNARLGAEIASLVGFSYFVFRALSFLQIQAILRFKEANPWGLLFYSLFPPTIASGPIHRYQDFRNQLATPRPLSGSMLSAAGYRITRGYFRKVVVAAFLNDGVARFLSNEHSSAYLSVAMIVLLYLYFYFDFAGYSDIAIGCGLLLGIAVPENFRRPFVATTVAEFWRNWHITLVDWFRDHVFIPLGGMRGSRQRAGTVALLVMVLCGLWHGATWSFVLWGAWHGFALLIEAVRGTTPIPPAQRHGARYWSRVLWTNCRVALPCILFLPDADILRIVSGFAHWSLG